MQPFKSIVEDVVQHASANDLREAIIDFYVAETDLFEDEDDETIVEDVGLEIISELADIFTPEQSGTIMEKLVEASGIDVEYLKELDEDDGEDEEDEDEIEEAKRFRIIKKKDIRKLGLKRKAVKKIGAKATTAAFRAKKVFDPKRKRFVTRKKVRSVAAQKKSDREFTKRTTRRRKARGG